MQGSRHLHGGLGQKFDYSLFDIQIVSDSRLCADFRGFLRLSQKPVDFYEQSRTTEE